MSKLEAFLSDIIAVCHRHQLVLTVSEYDNLQVWPLDTNALEAIRLADDRTPYYRVSIVTD